MASAFALEPQVILLDEPTSGVSTADKHGIMQTLIEAAKVAGVKGILLVEHDMDLVAAYSHRIVALSEGKVLADLPTDGVLQRPASDRDRDRQAQGSLMLRVRDLAVDIQGSPVLRRVSFEVNAGELVCLVGRNGAGKTTSLRTIMGFRRPASGAIEFNGTSIVGLRPFQIARMGIGFAPEESEVFGELTVAENIALPTWTCPSERTPKRASRTLIACSRSLRASATAAATRSPAASARWSRSPARSRLRLSCSCSTSRPKGFPR